MKGIFSILLILAVASVQAHADIYSYTDSEGATHFTDAPSLREFKLFLSDKKGPPPKKISRKEADVRFDRMVKKIEKFIDNIMHKDAKVSCWREKTPAETVVKCAMVIRERDPGKNPRYIHQMQAVTAQIAYALYGMDQPPSFEIVTIGVIDGGSFIIRRYSYTKYLAPRHLEWVMV